MEEHTNDDDLRPMLGLDAYDPVAKPRKIHNSYSVKHVMTKNSATMNLMFDRELSRLQSNRDKINGFFREQQRWLTDLKCDIDTKFSAQVPAVRPTPALPQSFNFYSARGAGVQSESNSLVLLRNHLSDLIN